MLQKTPGHYGDDTCAACVQAGDYLFLAHHGGGQDVDNLAHQTRAALESMAATLRQFGATLEDLVQVNYYIKDTADFRSGADVFREFFPSGPPARTTVVTRFIGSSCLCQIDGIAYLPKSKGQNELQHRIKAAYIILTIIQRINPPRQYFFFTIRHAVRYVVNLS